MGIVLMAHGPSDRGRKQAGLAREIGARIAYERRLKSLRDGRDITHVDLAKAAGVTPATVSRWESGESPPKDGALIRLAHYFGVTRGWLRYGEEPREAQSVVPTTEQLRREPTRVDETTAADRDRKQPESPRKKRRGR